MRGELRTYSHLNRSGRQKGQLNRSTVLIKEAILAVYMDLQEGEGGEHPFQGVGNRESHRILQDVPQARADPGESRDVRLDRGDRLQGHQ
jgi:hypothetical protein